MFAADMLNIVTQFQDSIIDGLEKEILFLIAQSDLFNDIPSAQIKDNDIITILREKGYSRDRIKHSINLLSHRKLLVMPVPKPARLKQHNLNKTLFGLLRN